MAPPQAKKGDAEHASTSAAPATGVEATKISKKKSKQPSRIVEDPAKIATDSRGWILDKKLRTCKQVDARLAQLLPKDQLEDVSFCLKAAILKGFIDLSAENPLDQIIFTGSIPVPCDCEAAQNIESITIRVRDVIYQADSGTTEDGHVACAGCGEQRYFLSRMCMGTPQIENGAKSHAHCKECKTFGKCVFDYRNEHCDQCGRHGFRGCPTCDGDGGRDECVIS